MEREAVTVRLLEREDIERGFLQALDGLFWGKLHLTIERAYAVYDRMMRENETSRDADEEGEVSGERMMAEAHIARYAIFVACAGDRVVGTATMFSHPRSYLYVCEQKFAHGGGRAWYGRDIARDQQFSMWNVLRRSMKDLMVHGRGCYKQLVYSALANVDFYKSLGFKECAEEYVMERSIDPAEGIVIGHLEDVSVDPTYQGGGVGGVLQKAITAYIDERPAYARVVLTCDAVRRPDRVYLPDWYAKKWGFRITNLRCMRKDNG